MLKTLRGNYKNLVRNYTSKAKRSVLAQDTQSIPTYDFPHSTPDKSRVYVWGLSANGALGLHTSLKKHGEPQAVMIQHPSRLKFAENCDVTNIASGHGFTAFAVDRSDGETLFGTGLNTSGQLGIQEQSVAGRVKSLELLVYPSAISLPRREGDTDDGMKIDLMSAGRNHLVVQTKSGAVFTLGNNCFGQCGRKIVEQEIYKGKSNITRIENVAGVDDEIVQIECGQDHTLFLTKSGRVLSCGWGGDGQTGLGHYDSTGDICPVEGDIKGEKIIKVASKCDCVLAVNDKGEVFGWGNTEYGQLWNDDEKVPQVNTPRNLKNTKGFHKIIDVASGGSFCLMLNEHGDVFSWGFGILGFGPNVETSFRPKQLLPPLFGCNEFNTETKVTSIHSGVFHMGAINTDGDLFMWGKNKFGCLGLGHKKDQYFPFKCAINGKVLNASCGADHTIALCKPFI